LRALRADDRIDDRPALAEMGEADADYIDGRAAQWESDTTYSWAVCEPTTGELLAEVTLSPATGLIGLRARPGHAEAAHVLGRDHHDGQYVQAIEEDCVHVEEVTGHNPGSLGTEEPARASTKKAPFASRIRRLVPAFRCCSSPVEG